MSYCKSRGLGQYVTGEGHYLLWGRAAKPGVAKGVVCCQGSHGLADTVLFQDSWQRAKALMDSGFVLAQGDMGQTLTQGTFGNDTAQARVESLRAYCQGASSFPAASGKVHLIGGSGGCTAAINYARAHPANVASMYLIVPLVDIDNFYTLHADASVPQSEINKAYNGGVDDGGTAYRAALATHSPVLASNLSALAGIPMRLAYSDNDPYIDPATVINFAGLVRGAGGKASYYSQGAVGHAGTGVDPQDVVSFFQANP